MGNCIERCKNGVQFEEQEMKRPQILLPRVEDTSKLRGMRVKIVLTREELQMLMVELKSKGVGQRSLEDVLDEIERGRRRSVNVGGVSSSSWKPSLESIDEAEFYDETVIE